MNRCIVFFNTFAKLLFPIVGAFFFGFLALSGVKTTGVLPAFWFTVIAALILMFVAFYLYHKDGDIFVAYGCAMGSVGLLYATVFQAFVSFSLFKPVVAFWYLTFIALAAAYASVRFQGWLLAIGAIAMALMTPSIVLGVISRQFLAWYFISFLALSMIIAYWRKWFELAILSFFGYLLYNPLLFGITDLEGKKGFLSIFQVFYITGAIFIIYTCIPFVYSLVRTRARIFEGVSITLGGAYSFALICYVIQDQLSKIDKLPFFIKALVGKTPIINDIQFYMFVVFALMYAILFLLLYLVNRRSKTVLTTLASLMIICLIGAFYAQRQSTGFLRYVVQIRRYITQRIKR